MILFARRFASSTRLLIGNSLNTNMSSPIIVKASVCHEGQVQRIVNTNKASNVNSGELLNNSCNMEFNETARLLTANFRNLQIKKIKRAEKSGTVHDEKFAILYQIQVSVGDLRLSLWTLSVPFVVIVHGNYKFEMLQLKVNVLYFQVVKKAFREQRFYGTIRFPRFIDFRS